MWKDILIHCDGSEAGRSRIEYATAMATQFGARLTGLHVTAPIEVPPVYRARDVDVVAERMETNAKLDAELSRRSFEEVTKQIALPHVWHDAHGDMIEQLCAYARYADLVILGQYARVGSAERHPMPLASPVAIRCGRPVLIVPANWIDFEPAPKVLLAWDGSREAVRAIHDALPLLGLAKSIVVLTIAPESERTADRLAETQLLIGHLKQHGLHATCDLTSNHTESQALMDRLDPRDFQLLVMGAYSHPRWFELIFGGVTKSVLLSAPVPVLLSH